MLPSQAAISLKDARDHRVFEAVRQLLAVHGMQLSMDAVAAQAGCSKQTLYCRYGSKRGLLRQVMQEHISITVAPLSLADERPIHEALLDFATGYLEHRSQPHVVQTSQLIVSGAYEFREEARSLYYGSAEMLQSHMAEWMQIQIDKGRLDDGDPTFMAELLISMIAGLDFDRQRFHVPHRDDAQSRRRWTEFCINRFLRAFAPPGQTSMQPPHTNTTRSFS